MGSGIEAARIDSPEHAQVIDDFKDQLLLCLVKRLGKLEKDGVVKIPVSEVDDTGGFVMSFSIKNQVFNLKVTGKH